MVSGIKQAVDKLSIKKNGYAPKRYKNNVIFLENQKK